MTTAACWPTLPSTSCRSAPEKYVCPSLGQSISHDATTSSCTGPARRTTAHRRAAGQHLDGRFRQTRRWPVPGGSAALRRRRCHVGHPIWEGYTGSLNSVVQTRQGRLLLPFAYLTRRTWAERGDGLDAFWYAGQMNSTVLFSDDGVGWRLSTPELKVQTPSIGLYGGCEPVVVERADGGGLWMQVPAFPLRPRYRLPLPGGAARRHDPGDDRTGRGPARRRRHRSGLALPDHAARKPGWGEHAGGVVGLRMSRGLDAATWRRPRPARGAYGCRLAGGGRMEPSPWAAAGV